MDRLSLVTNGSWCVSTSYPRYDNAGQVLPGVELHTFKIHQIGHRHTVFQYGEGYGKVFADSNQANAWALERGYLQPYVHPWCLTHRVQHTFLGKKCGFCLKDS